MNQKQTADAVCGAALAFGAAGLMAPRVLGQVIGMPADTEPLLGMARLLASRNVVLGLIPRVLKLSKSDYGPFLMTAAAMNALDTVNVMAAGVKGGLPKRGAVTLGIITATLAGLAAAAAAGGE